MTAEGTVDTRAGEPPRVAIVGRQNVGKSTLFNRLLGRRAAIADEMPGVTRDRLELPVIWGGRSFVLVDTGGFMQKARGIEATVGRQAARAVDEADLILLVVDATSGVQEEDAVLAKTLRRSTRSVVVVANKVDSERQEPMAAEFHKLGLGEPMPVSALHGRGSGDLLDLVVELLPEGPEPGPSEEALFALVGRPNVGKSSLFNRLVEDDRAVVHDEPGTTRDAIDSVLEVEGQRLRFIDTAGLRRQIKTKGVEYYGLLRSLRAIESSHVSLLVVDASEGLTGDDKRIAARVVEAGRGLVVALNKWDLVPSEDRSRLFEDLTEELRVFPGTPVIRTSALRGTGVGRVIPALRQVHESWARRVPTAEVNRVLRAASEAHPPPRAAGRILYGTQVSAAPPTFVLFGTAQPPASYRRYLEHALRKAFRFEGVPVRLAFRQRRDRRAGKSR
jgi:GTP-binding protein